MPPATISASETMPIWVTGGGRVWLSTGELGHDHERRDLHGAEDARRVDEALHRVLDLRRVGRRLLQLGQHRDVRRLEQAQRDHGHDAYDDEAGHDPAV